MGVFFFFTQTAPFFFLQHSVFFCLSSTLCLNILLNYDEFNFEYFQSKPQEVHFEKDLESSFDGWDLMADVSHKGDRSMLEPELISILQQAITTFRVFESSILFLTHTLFGGFVLRRVSADLRLVFEIGD